MYSCPEVKEEDTKSGSKQPDHLKMVSEIFQVCQQVYGLVWPGSMTSGAEGFTNLCLQKGETGDPKIFKTAATI